MVLALGAGAIAVGVGVDGLPVVRSANVQVLVRTLAVALVAMVGGLALAHHRATGLAVGRRLSATVAVLGFAAALALLQVVVDPEALPAAVTTELTRSVLTALAGATLLWSVSGPQIDGRSLLLPMTALAVASVVALAASVALPEGFVVPLTAAGLDHLLPASAWLVAAALGWRYVRRHPEPLGYGALAAAPLVALAELLRAAEPLGVVITVSSVPMLRVAALLAIGLGATLGLADSSVLQRSRNHEQQVERRIAADAAHAEQQRHVHEVRNALVAIEGATVRLRAGAQAADVADRDQLAAALADGVGHLRRLLEPAPPKSTGAPPPTPRRPRRVRPPAAETSADARTTPPPDSTTSVRPTLTAACVLARARGVHVTTDLTDVEVALAPTPLRQVVENLLGNVERHAGPDAHCHLAARVSDGWVEVVLDDNGPGIAAADRARALTVEGQVGADRSGRGLGLPIVAEVVEAAGGELTLGEAPTGGLRVHLRLPAAGSDAPATGVGDPRPDTGDDGVEVDEELGGFAGCCASDDPSTRGGR